MSIDPDKAKQLLHEHFETVSEEDFERRLRRRSPGSIDRAIAVNRGSSVAPASEEQLAFLLQSSTAGPLPLSAYIATALTGLSVPDRDVIRDLSDIVADVCRDVRIAPYQPHKSTDPVLHRDISVEEVYRIDRENVLNSDVLIHLCHFPSTGAGQELAFAYDALLPIVLVMHSTGQASRMVRGMPCFKIELIYSDIEQLKRELTRRLTEIRPLLEERKLAFSDFNRNLIGHRIRELREESGLTRADVAHKVGLSTEGLEHIEESADRISNPTLLQLRQIATVLRTTVADLVEPGLGGRLLVMLDEWINTGRAARYGVSERDARRLLRRILYRVVDQLDKE